MVKGAEEIGAEGLQLRLRYRWRTLQASIVPKRAVLLSFHYWHRESEFGAVLLIETVWTS